MKTTASVICLNQPTLISTSRMKSKPRCCIENIKLHQKGVILFPHKLSTSLYKTPKMDGITYYCTSFHPFSGKKAILWTRKKAE
jgi:protein associated with RNAse G/E